MMGPGHTPFARAIGMTMEAGSRGSASARLRACSANAWSVSDRRIHPLALAGLLDEVSGRALATAVDGEAGMLTLELRIDFTAQGADGDVTAEACCEGEPGPARLIRGKAYDASGRVVACSVAWFALGAFPGEGRGAAADASPALPTTSDEAAGPFELLCGLERREGSAILTAGTPSVIGYAGLPAVHGGVVAALLAVACEQRVFGMGGAAMSLASLSVRFLRAAGLQGLEADAECRRVGRQIAHATAICRHKDGPVVAEANAAFLRMA